MEDKTYINSLFNLGKLTVFLIILGDFARKISIFFDFQFIRYTAVFKVLLLVIYGLFFLFYYRHYFKIKEINNLGKIILALTIVFVLSNLFPFNYAKFNPGNLEYLVRYLFFPITLFIFYNLFSEQIKIQKLFKIYEVFFFVNLILIIVGFVFDFDLFKSYPTSERFGYSGLMNRTTQISYISLMMILIYYYKSVYLKQNTYLKLLFVILVSLLIGTKRIYFTLIILGIFHFYKFRNSYTWKNVILSLSLALSIIFIFWNSIEQLVFPKIKIFIDIYEDKGFLSSFLSFRNDLLIQIIQEEIITKWNFFNILVGGVDFTIIRPEMDFFDVFFFFGLIGVFLYCYFIKIFLKIINIKSKLLLGFLGVILLISFTSSGFLNSVNIPFIFFICIFFLNDQVNNKLLSETKL